MHWRAMPGRRRVDLPLSSALQATPLCGQDAREDPPHDAASLSPPPTLALILSLRSCDLAVVRARGRRRMPPTPATSRPAVDTTFTASPSCTPTPKELAREAAIRPHRPLLPRLRPPRPRSMRRRPATPALAGHSIVLRVRVRTSLALSSSPIPLGTAPTVDAPLPPPNLVAGKPPVTIWSRAPLPLSPLGAL